MPGMASYVGIEKGKAFEPGDARKAIFDRVAKDVQAYILRVNNGTALMDIPAPLLLTIQKGVIFHRAMTWRKKKMVPAISLLVRVHQRDWKRTFHWFANLWTRAGVTEWFVQDAPIRSNGID